MSATEGEGDFVRYAIANHQIAANNQQNLERGKDEFHLAIDADEEHVGNYQQAAKENDPCGSGRPVVPKRDDDGGGGQLGRQGDEVVVDGIPALGKGEGGIDKVLGVPDDGS